MKFILLLCLLAFSLAGHAQTSFYRIIIVDSGQDCSIRGMSIPSNDVVWLSGSKGHVARSTDAGKTWKWMDVAGYEETDFRDIHAFDSSTAIIMGIDNPAHILKTKDGGQTWQQVFTKEAPGMFLDALDFLNDKDGICIGDPLDEGSGRKKFFVIRTKDGGDTWIPETSENLPQAAVGEAVFSASGTNIALLDNKDFDYAFISGGMVSNLYLIGRKGKPNAVFPLGMNKGKESAGAFSMATDGRKKFYCIGGDYKEPENKKDNFVWTTDKGKGWQTPSISAPTGYRSCIRIIDGKRLVACGSIGVDIGDGPNKWKRISGEGFNVCMVSLDRKLVFFGGGKGKIGVMGL